MVVVTIFSIISMISWFATLVIYYFRLQLIKRLLQAGHRKKKITTMEVSEFMNYRGWDGYFLIKMTTINYGDYITSETLKQLHKQYKRDVSDNV